MSINSRCYGFSSDLDLLKAQEKNAPPEWIAYYSYMVERAEYWISNGDNAWPNAREPKTESIDFLACSRAKTEAMDKFGVVYEDIGHDAEGRYL